MNMYRLIENAQHSLNCCEKAKSSWGINYWTVVLKSLLRRYNTEKTF